MILNGLWTKSKRKTMPSFRTKDAFCSSTIIDWERAQWNNWVLSNLNIYTNSMTQ